MNKVIKRTVKFILTRRKQKRYKQEKKRPYESATYDLYFLDCLYFLPFSLSRMFSQSLQLIFTQSSKSLSLFSSTQILNHTNLAANCALTATVVQFTLHGTHLFSLATESSARRHCVHSSACHSASPKLTCFKTSAKSAEAKVQLEKLENHFAQKACLTHTSIKLRIK